MKLTGGRVEQHRMQTEDNGSYRQEYRMHEETSGRHLSVLTPEFRNILGLFVRPVLPAH